MKGTNGFYPVFLQLKGRRALVVGGGRMALTRTRQLLSAGAIVTVVAPEICEPLRALAGREAVKLTRRRFRRSDVKRKCFVVLAATNDPGAQEAVAEEAQRAGVLYSIVSNRQRGNFLTPAVVKRGSVTIAISTGGASPMLSGRLRRALEEALPGNLAEWTSLLADLRIQLKRALPDDLQGQRELIAQFIESVTQ